MDFSLEVPEAETTPSSKRAAVGSHSKDLVDTLGLVAKLSLSSAQQCRAIKSVVIDVVRAPADAPIVKAVKAATKAYAEAAKKIVDANTRAEKLGPPHVHAWNACIKNFKGVLEASSTEQDKKVLQGLTKYIAEKNPGWRTVIDEVMHVRVRKNFNRDLVCLEFHVRPQTHSGEVFSKLMEWMEKQQGFSRMHGQAPPGDLERRLQTWLEQQGMSTPMNNES